MFCALHVVCILWTAFRVRTVVGCECTTVLMLGVSIDTSVESMSRWRYYTRRCDATVVKDSF